MSRVARKRLARIATIAAACAVSPAAIAAEPPTPARATANLAGLISSDDYPDEALRNDEQGTVGFRLDVGADGSPTACSVTSSSGSASLDATTCRIMMERARFRAARNAGGDPVPDAVTARIVWRIQVDESPRENAISTLWSTCVLGEASKLMMSERSSSEIIRLAFGPCAALEAALAKEVKAEIPLTEVRADLSRAIEQGVTETRKALAATPDGP
jgi:TonB family protein